jgi:hypothetical protein
MNFQLLCGPCNVEKGTSQVDYRDRAGLEKLHALTAAAVAGGFPPSWTA